MGRGTRSQSVGGALQPGLYTSCPGASDSPLSKGLLLCFPELEACPGHPA